MRDIAITVLCIILMSHYMLKWPQDSFHYYKSGETRPKKVEGQTKVYVPVTWEFCVPVMENFIPASMVWNAIATKHD